MNQFGERIKHLRVQRSFFQKLVAEKLNIDTPMLSKIERGERPAKREQVTILSKIFEVPEKDLLSLWLADKLYDIVKGEEMGLKALSVTEDEVKKRKKNTK